MVYALVGIKKLNLLLIFFGVVMLGLFSTADLKADDSNSEKSSMGLSLGLIGGVVYDTSSMSNNDISIDTSGKAMFGGGITAEISLPAKLGVELDMLYIKHQFSRNTAEFFGANVNSTASSGFLQFPLILRAHFIPFLNPGVGFYYGRSVTSWSVSADNFNSTTTNYGKNDFGFVLALGTGIPIGDIINLVADLRYTRSLNDSGGSANTSLKFSQIQLLVGFRFDL